MNVSSRFGYACEPWKIRASETTVDLVIGAGDIRFEARGPVNVKVRTADRVLVVLERMCFWRSFSFVFVFHVLIFGVLAVFEHTVASGQVVYDDLNLAY